MADWKADFAAILAREDDGRVGVEDLVADIEELLEDHAGCWALAPLEEALEAYHADVVDYERWQGRAGYDAEGKFREAVEAFATEHDVMPAAAPEGIVIVERGPTGPGAG